MKGIQQGERGTIRSWQIVWLSWTLLLLGGCQPQQPANTPAVPLTPASPTTPATAPDPSKPPVPSTGSSATATEPLAAAHGTAAAEYWDALYINDSRVGFSHTRYVPTTEQGRALLQVVARSELTMQRFGQTVTQKMSFTSVEEPDGRVLRCESKMTSAGTAAEPVEITTDAHVAGEKLLFRIGTHGKSESASIPWNKAWGGFFAAEQTLERNPMQPGETRRLHALMAGYNQVAAIDFEAVGYERTRMLSGEEELLRIEAKIKLGQSGLDQTIWTDRAGQTRKTQMAAMNLSTFRTTEQVALQRADGGFDLGLQTTVRIERPIDRPHETRHALYRISLKRGDVGKAFVPGVTQRVQAISDREIEVTVRALRPDDPLGTEFALDRPPGQSELAANALIQSDDQQVQQLARSIAPEERDHWKLALALERHVRQYVSNRSFAQAMASAADVVRSREGDCTEHAVLLAALCRVREIPARVAIGLVYSQQVAGFAYHMWTEVWIKDRWIPIDSTLAQGGIGAAHLKVSHSDLQGVDPFSQFLAVFQLIGNVQIDVLTIE